MLLKSENHQRTNAPVKIFNSIKTFSCANNPYALNNIKSPGIFQCLYDIKNQSSECKKLTQPNVLLKHTATFTLTFANLLEYTLFIRIYW